MDKDLVDTKLENKCIIMIYRVKFDLNVQYIHFVPVFIYFYLNV